MKLPKGWKDFTETSTEFELPKSALDSIKADMFQYGGQVQVALYKGEIPEEAKEWIIVTDNGGFYKVGAQFVMWFTKADYPDGYGCQCYWSSKALVTSITSLMSKGVTVRDSDYQT
jgi:hypothetical protein